MSANTLFLRLEGPLQAWGSHEAKFVIRRAMDAPTKSGVIGLLLAVLGIGRAEARRDWLEWLGNLRMGVRIDRPGIRWWDYHTVGAKEKMRIAAGGTRPGKPQAMLTRREYLCDASFLVALQGDPELIVELEGALEKPQWTLYLGRKCCPPSRPILEKDAVGEFDSLRTALASRLWQPRLKGETPPNPLELVLDWEHKEGDISPDDAEVWYDVPYSLDPPAHHPRFAVRDRIEVGVEKEPLVSRVLAPPRPRAGYDNSAYKEARKVRLKSDHHLCVFCKSPLFGRGATVHHITYRRAGGDETLDDLRSLCRLCHDAVTMIEYGLGMGLDRINPEEEMWRESIHRKRKEIIKFRSLETRRRKLGSEEEAA